MTIKLDVELSPEQKAALAKTDPRWWFTTVEFANATSPIHPKIERLEIASSAKRTMVLPSLQRLAPGKRVLDLFCANGAFSFEAARLGASEVLGVDYDEARIECASYTASLVNGSLTPVPSFRFGNIYELDTIVRDPFDLTLALGGLYHLSDPVLALRNIRAATAAGGHMILQTSRIIRLPGSWAKFLMVERTVDRTEGKAGVWKLSPKAVETMLAFAGFEILERLPVERLRGRKMAWYGAVCRAV